MAGDWQVIGRVIDESIGGIGVAVSEPIPISDHHSVDVIFPDFQTVGYVRSVHARNDGGFHVGLSWNNVDENQSGAVKKSNALTASFYRHEIFSVVCAIKQRQPNGQVVVILWDDAEFEVESDRVSMRDRESRRSELIGMGKTVIGLARLYGLNSVQPMTKLIDDILSFEFQSP